MPFPETITDLAQAGYRYESDAACRGCGARIEWWTSPAGKMMPMEVDNDGNCETHWANCPKAKEFRNR